MCVALLFLLAGVLLTPVPSISVPISTHPRGRTEPELVTLTEPWLTVTSRFADLFKSVRRRIVQTQTVFLWAHTLPFSRSRFIMRR